jgi:hypothetical protein
MHMHMVVAVKFKSLNRHQEIDGGMTVLAILDFVRLVQGLFPFADKDHQLLPAFGYDFRPHKDLPEDVMRARHSNTGLLALAVDEQFDCFTGHLPSPLGAPPACHLRPPAGNAIIGVCMGNVLEIRISLSNQPSTAEFVKVLSIQTTEYHNSSPCQ